MTHLVEITYGKDKNAKSEKMYTDAGYAEKMKKSGNMTPAAEDYLEMIYRLSRDGEEMKPVRICDLASHLHVSPSSASRMAQSMAVWGYIDFRRYGYITVTKKGCEMGEYLIRRHRIVLDFLTWLRGGGDVLTETERIEHYLSPETVQAMEEKIKK
ncbi:MAG: metal-dependent transcriptional regulator [Ruminococcaceae bacterium]|nr:metal-dependent transcriptional regulator [Oscillospiraceae bacterium]